MNILRISVALAIGTLGHGTSVALATGTSGQCPQKEDPTVNTGNRLR